MNEAVFNRGYEREDMKESRAPVTFQPPTPPVAPPPSPTSQATRRAARHRQRPCPAARRSLPVPSCPPYRATTLPCHRRDNRARAHRVRQRGLSALSLYLPLYFLSPATT